jgi:UDP-glucuronate decarboxylase
MIKHKTIKDDVERITQVLGDEARALEGKSLVISGGSGFLGSYIVAIIHNLNQNVFTKPCKVLSIDNYITGSRENLVHDIKSGNIMFTEGNIQEPLKIDGPVDYIIHAAGLASPFITRSIRSRRSKLLLVDPGICWNLRE